MNNLKNRLINHEARLAVVGLGYVGMPIAVAFASKEIDVIGYDTNEVKIKLYRRGIDPTNEVGNDAIKATKVQFTNDEKELSKASFIIVAVPTPVNQDHTPNLNPVERASETIGRNLSKNTIIVYESTVYPGVTEDICIPILEKESGLKCGLDFKVGYSPERINPGDKIHTLTNIKKIVSGMDSESCEQIKSVYDIVINVGTYPVSSIKTAEAIKVVENSQRDINIAFMNELAMVFDRMGIDTNEVVDGMNTKWNALGFRPGLVGGHCIGVDPYYFTYEAEKLGYHSQIILNGRIVNDSMGTFVADIAIKKMVEVGLAPKNSKVVIMGMTFKENCPDVRNSKVIDIITRLQEYSIDPIVVDPWASADDSWREYGIKLASIKEIQDVDCIIIAVAHDQYLKMNLDDLKKYYRNTSDNKKVLLDVKGIYSINLLIKSGLSFWRL
ncbi:MAG: nucleotide sugar dehydrogenase [Lachnospiraceae bacterium]|jgi:UDP-N-acetyl-D-galactosamine dehydrogenase|nr:nucleotide sugar dehydrogenase [Lachnospiraceae bacterium]